MKTKLQKNDMVKVLCGKDKGKISTITRVFGDRIIVKNINICTKHQKPTKHNPDGGIIRKETYLHKSNVMYYLKDCHRVSRVGFKTIANKKIRYFIKRKEKLIS